MEYCTQRQDESRYATYLQDTGTIRAIFSENLSISAAKDENERRDNAHAQPNAIVSLEKWRLPVV